MGDSQCILAIKTTWDKLSDTWSGISCYCTYIEDLEALPIQGNIFYLHRPQKSKVHFKLEGTNFETKALGGIIKRLWLYNWVSPW